MTASFLITFREALEASVIVGILFSTLRLLGEQKRGIFIWGGVSVGILGSLFLAWIFESVLNGFAGRIEQIYEGTLLFIAFALITHMVMWMRRHGKDIKMKLQGKLQVILDQKELWALFILAFTAVLREGVETVIFLKALSFQSAGALSLWGGFLGLIAAVALALLIFFSTLKISPKKFFQYTGIFLIFVAAGLLLHSIGEFQEAQLLPNFMNPVFDLSAVLSAEHGFGLFLKTLFGYNPAPSLLALICYTGYLGTMFFSFRRQKKN